MYLLLLSQYGNEIKLGLFETLEEGREFAKKLPGYRLDEDEDGFFCESLSLDEIPEYMQVEHKGNIVPISRLSFVEEEDVDIFWYELPVISNNGSGMVDGITRVDAYSIDNNDVEDYIRKREAKYEEVASYLSKKGFEADRSFFGSEDGEAIVYKRKGEDEWHFLSHMDPWFVENEEEVECFCEAAIGIF